MWIQLSSMWLLLFFAVALVDARPLAPTSGRRTLRTRLLPRATLPANDPFYAPPANLQSCTPGQVFKSRTVSTAAFGQLPLDVTAYQLQYCTTSANSTKLADVTTVFQPTGARKNQLLSFATAEDSDASQCAPSYTYESGSTQPNAITSFEELFIIAFLDQGYTVTAPDYEGPNSAFSAGRLEGHGVLDSLRAAISFPALGFDSSSTQVAGYGYSGGAIATGWAAALQPTYAPELKVVGWAHGGTPANLTSTLEYLDGGLFAGFGVGGIAGLVSAYSSLQGLLNRIATQKAKDALNYAYTHCATDDLGEFAFKTFQSTEYQSEGAGLLSDPTVVAVTSANLLGGKKSETPTAPLFVYHSKFDEIIPYSGAATMVDSYCNNGVKSLIFATDIGPSEHASGEILFFPDALNFINDRFAGKAPVSGCQRTSTVLPLIDQGALPTTLDFIVDDLLSVLTGQVGPDDSLLKVAVTVSAASKGNFPPA